MIIVIGGEKGGSGKSCLAQNLAVFLLLKDRDVLLVDADIQGTSTDWTKERNKNNSVPKINSVQASGDIRETLLDLHTRYQDIVIDVGGQDSDSFRSAMGVATHLLLPFRPKRRDLKTLIKMDQLVRAVKTFNKDLYVRSIITQCPTLPSQVKRILEAKEVCQSFNLLPLNAITTNRNIYDDADEKGLTVIESKADPKAVDEINEIGNEFFFFFL